MAGFRDAIAADVGPTPTRVRHTPPGFDSVSAFLSDMRQKYEWGYSFNEHNIIAGKDDAKFTVGKQWDPIVEQKRRDAKKPVLTFNRLIAFVAQIIGNRLMNETEIRVHPDKQGTKQVAAIREGLIRSIFKNGRAQFARDEANKYQVVGGQGVFCLAMEYTSDDVFEQEIRLQACTDPYSAIFDPLGIEPSGEDCQWAFVSDDIPQQEFAHRYPWASQTSFDNQRTWNQSGFWLTEDTVRIVGFWRMITEGIKTLALYQDGSVHDVTGKEEYEFMPFVETRADGSPYIRDVPKRFARLYICSGNEILEGPFDYPCSSLPVYRVPGWELNDGERVHRWGLIRFLKDPQRLHNYWRSTVAEQLVAAPRNKFLATPDAVKGHEVKWRRAPTSDDPFLYYNDGETPPVHIPPPGIDAALVNEAGLATQDLKDISNIHEAALGMPSNEVSKVAIQQRQQVSDVGTFIYTDRMRIADTRCAKNIDELIPYIYDTKRTVTVIGRDDKAILQTINDPSDPNSDVTIGKYNVTVSIGPATETKRALAAEQMMSFVNAAPQVASLVMDLVAEAQDWPKSDQFAARFKTMLPPGIIPPDEMTPQMLQMQEQNSKMQEMQAQLAAAAQSAKTSLDQAKASDATSRAHLAMAQAYKAIVDAHSRASDVMGKNSERGHRAVMDAIDQHNDLIGEDREFGLDTDAQAHDQHMDQQYQKGEEAAQQHSMGMDVGNLFAKLHQIDLDFRAQKQFRDYSAESTGNNGSSGQ